MSEWNRRELLLGAAAALAAGTAAVLPTGAVAATADGPEARSAQAPCRIASVRLRSYYSARARDHYMIFSPTVRCDRSSRGWKVKVTIRRRRLGPDAQVAYKAFKGQGSRRFVLATRCKRGSSFNGDIWLDIEGGPNYHAVKKNVRC